MKIPKKYPQFDSQSVLFVVTGFHESEFLLAKDGEIKKLKEFKIDLGRYTDREGFFQRIGLGRYFSSGAVRERSKKEVLDKFLHQLNQTMSQLSKRYDFDHYYLFAPDYVLPQVLAATKKWLGEALVTFAGNYYKESELSLLKKIAEQKKLAEEISEQAEISDEAKKILDKTD